MPLAASNLADRLLGSGVVGAGVALCSVVVVALAAAVVSALPEGAWAVGVVALAAAVVSALPEGACAVVVAALAAAVVSALPEGAWAVVVGCDVAGAESQAVEPATRAQRSVNAGPSQTLKQKELHQAHVSRTCLAGVLARGAREARAGPCYTAGSLSASPPACA